MKSGTLTYEEKLVAGWEDVYRKGQLSLFMLLALKDGPKYTAEIKDFILKLSNGLQTTDEQSLYRALRRYHKVGMVAYLEEGDTGGAKRKRYTLTNIGSEVLERFVRRNIIDVLYRADVRAIISKGWK